MALKTFVLISTVNNLSDARYCAGMDVDLIGFNMEEGNANYIAPETFKELTEWLSGVDFVGEFENTDSDEIETVLKEYGTDFVEVRNPELVAALKDNGRTVILRQSIEGVDIGDAKPNFVVLESEQSEVSSEHIEKIKKLAAEHKVLIGFGVNDQNVEQLLSESSAYGVALRGGDEIKPGYKDYDELADILEALEIDDLA